MASTRVSQIVRKPYARIIVPDGEGGYAAQVLEFPGCFADGESPEEAYSNLEEVAESWVESALAQGFPVPPPVATQGHSGTVSLRLPKSLHKRAVELANRDGVSLNQFLVTAIAGRVGAENLTETIASKLDDRLDRLQTTETEWVPMEGLMRRISVAATRGSQISVNTEDWDRESAGLPSGRDFLPKLED